MTEGTVHPKMTVDATVLQYALDASGRFHRSVNEWLERSVNEPSRVGLPWALQAFE
jgi:predicted nucleic acid-binding protein